MAVLAATNEVDDIKDRDHDDEEAEEEEDASQGRHTSKHAIGARVVGASVRGRWRDRNGGTGGSRRRHRRQGRCWCCCCCGGGGHDFMNSKHDVGRTVVVYAVVK